MTCILMHSRPTFYSYGANWLLYTVVKPSCISFSSPMGNTEPGRLSDCRSSHTELQQSRGSRVEWINKRSDSSCRWICFCPCLCFFFFFFPPSHESIWFPAPQSFTMCIIYIIDYCSAGRFNFKKLRSVDSDVEMTAEATNHKCNHRYYFNV